MRDRALQLINQYTVAGSKVKETYNNQSDYLLKIPGLVNDAMTEIATTNRKIHAVCQTCELEGIMQGDYTLYTMPDNFFQFKSGGVYELKNESLVDSNRFRFVGVNQILIPNGVQAAIEYYRLPELLGVNPKDEDDLDNTVDTHYAIPFYVAAYLVMHDDAFLYATLYNKYEDKLAKMIPDVRAEVGPIVDAYGGA